MIKKICKTVFLACSIVTTGVLGFIFSNDNTDKTTTTTLKEPIFSIETAHADGAGGDCCCPSDWPAPPSVATVYISDPTIYYK